MAGLQDIPGKKQGTIKAYRLTIKTPGAPLVNIQLSARKYTRREAETLRAIAEAIEAAYRMGDEIGKRTQEKLNLYPDFKKRLADKGVIDIAEVLTIEALAARYFADFPQWKQTTATNKTYSLRRFYTFFSPSLSAEAITKKDAQQWKDYLDRQIVAGEIKEATAAGCIRDIKALFNWAVKNDYLDRNPLEHIKQGSFTNNARAEYISMERIKPLLAASDSTLLSAFILIVRRLGLRVPSETSALQWKDVDFNRGLIYIRSPKTEHIKGKEQRRAPLFSDLRRVLSLLKQEQAAQGIEGGYIFGAFSSSNHALHERIETLARRADVPLWGRLFQNMRLSASVDIVDRFGVDCENLWIGHGEATRAKHYRGIADEKEQEAQQWEI